MRGALAHKSVEEQNAHEGNILPAGRLMNHAGTRVVWALLLLNAPGKQLATAEDVTRRSRRSQSPDASQGRRPCAPRGGSASSKPAAQDRHHAMRKGRAIPAPSLTSGATTACVPSLRAPPKQAARHPRKLRERGARHEPDKDEAGRSCAVGASVSMSNRRSLSAVRTRLAAALGRGRWQRRGKAVGGARA